MDDYPTMNVDMIRAALMNRNRSAEDCEVVPHDPSDVIELEEFCKNHGILGVNFGRMSPKSTLRMLKSRMGIRESPSEKILLKG